MSIGFFAIELIMTDNNGDVIGAKNGEGTKSEYGTARDCMNKFFNRQMRLSIIWYRLKYSLPVTLDTFLFKRSRQFPLAFYFIVLVASSI